MDVIEIRHRNLQVLLAELEQRGASRAKDQAQRLDGMNPSFLSQLKGGKKMGEDVARKLELAAGKPRGWMDVAQFPSSESIQASPENFESHPVARFEIGDSYVRFPLLEGFAGMGRGDYVVDYPEVVESLQVSREWVERKLPGIPPEAIRVITGRGDSMRGQYNDGDLIFLDTRVKTFDQDSAYCFRWEGRVLVKRLQFVGRNMLRILSKNPDYPAIDAPLDEIEIGGRALAAWTLSEF